MKVYILERSNDKKNWIVDSIYNSYELASNTLRKLNGYRRIREFEMKV